MTVTTEAFDPACYAPAEAWFEAGDLVDAAPEHPVGPGDPDEVFVAAAPVAGPRIEVEIGRAITREPIGFLSTAQVADWSEDVELLAGTAAAITASSSDPLWADLAESTYLKADGSLGYKWHPRGYIVWLYRDGVPVRSGVFAFFQPIDVGGGRVVLPAVGPQEQLARRILGRAEQEDLYKDAGSFEGYSSIAQMEADGWQFPEGVTASLVNDGVRGRKALRLVGGTGLGLWVRGPKVTVTGAEGYQRVVDGQVFGNFDADIPEGAVMARVRVQRVGAAGLSDELYSDENSGVRPNSEAGWTDDPITCAARMEPEAVAHHAWIELRSTALGGARYDLAQLRLSVQTGYPKGTNRDLADYVVRVMRDLSASAIGGHPHGLTTRIVSRTGVLASKRWSHAARTPVRDVLASILEAEGGPECRITSGWVLEVHRRLGSDRNDIALTNHDVSVPGWQTDPGAEVDDLIVDTGRGSGVNWLSVTVSTDPGPNRFRQVAMVQGLVDRSLNENEVWALAHARAAARQQVTEEVEVAWDLADELVTGDSFWTSFSDGDLVEERRMRLLRKRYLRTGRCVLSLGATDA